ncbi:chromosome segregation protein SMC [Thermaurantiacus sp.]
MKFEALRLSGFKSFVEPLEIEIRPGLTGIVGPNGCGKSNLLEALRWAMGESSARSLRAAGAAAGGGGMEDVIFAGTARRPARHAAEVTLVLDNSARLAPAAFNADDRLEVTRRIERGQGSDYRINGRDVRQRDVQILFADAATGAHSPALVSQGRVAAIISARPEERRQLLEDAAGIGGLAVRRREAEIRLKAADSNLARLADIMAAAEAQVGTLRRQARLALRYRDLSARIREAESAALRLALFEAKARMEGARDQAAAAEAALAEAIEAEAVARTAQANAAAGIPARRQAEAAAAARLQALMTARATLVAERVAARQRLADLKAAIEAALADRERAAARLSDSAATRARLQAERAATSAALLEAEAGLEPAAAAVAAAEQTATMAERALAEAVEHHAALLAEGRSVRAAADAAEARWKRLSAERDRQAAELQRLDGAGGLKRAAEGVAEAEAQLSHCSEAAEAAVARLSAAEASRRAAEDSRALLLAALAQARAEVHGLEAEADALRRLQVAPDRNLAAPPALAAEQGFEAALAAALGDDAAAPVGQPPEGRPQRHWQDIGAQPSDPALPSGLAALAHHVRAPAALARRLAQVAIVDSPPDPDLVARLAPGQRLVSRDGWMWRWDGFVAPPGGTASAVAERMRQANRLKDIAAELEEPRARLVQAEAELQRQKELLAAAEAEERQALGQRAEAIRQRDSVRARLEGLRNVAAQAEARRGAVVASLERLAAECASAGDELRAARSRVLELPDSSAAAAAVGEARSIAERARGDLARLRAELAGLRRTVDDGKARVAALAREMEAWDARDREAEAAAQALDQRIDRLKAEELALIGEPEALDARLATLEEDLGRAEAARASAAEAVLAAELALSELDRTARQRASDVADRREARAIAQAAFDAALERLEAVRQEAIDLLGQVPDAAEPTEAMRALAAGLEQLRAERERLGPVNLVAESELAEVEATLARQAAERAELETAVARLRGSIGALNREGRARLLAAFQDVDRHFRELFLTLFAGGSAELALIDSEDPLEAGLEIRAQPPGKRLQSLSLLSGGEQALTALALIFALFQTRPAPISVLDEVDAPLDDANVERFCRLLAHMADTTDTRFLIVTHNLITMAAMHRLYGVTMAEPGVSQLVSVDLSSAERLAAA